MSDDRWMDRLSEYLDGELAPEERRELEAHLARCATCKRTLEDLRAVVARAAALEDRPPAADLWPAVARGIGAGAGAGEAGGGALASFAARGGKSGKGGEHGGGAAK